MRPSLRRPIDFGLRAYGTQPQVWGGDPACAHGGWRAGGTVVVGNNAGKRGKGEVGPAPVAARKAAADGHQRHVPAGETCARCGCWRGELGAEPEVGMYVAHLVEVFRAVRRVLRPDATCWVTIGDSYAGSSMSGGTGKGTIIGSGHADRKGADLRLGTPRGHRGIPAKNLLLVPQRLALALQADGWIVRSVIRWCKAAPMPESVRDRPTSAVEEVLVLAKQADYYWDAEAVAEPHASATAGRDPYGARGEHYKLGRDGTSNGLRAHPTARDGHLGFGAAGRNMRNYWLLPPEPLDAPHYAAFPSAIPTRAILAATSEAGCCTTCGAPRKRQVERVASTIRRSAWGEGAGTRTAPSGTMLTPPMGVTTGWAPSCRCPHAAGPLAPPVVLDPFAGSGTTGLAALRLGRAFVGIDLQPDYIRLAIARLRRAASQPTLAEAMGAARGGEGRGDVALWEEGAEGGD